MYECLKLVLCLAAAVAVVVTAPAKLGNLGRQSFGASSFARRTLGGQNEFPLAILHNEHRVPDLKGAYSFRFETPEGIKRQEEGRPQAPTGAVAQNGEWSFFFPDGSRGTYKFEADDKGFRLLESEITTKSPMQIEQERLQIKQERLQAAKEKAHQRAESRRRLTFAVPPTI